VRSIAMPQVTTIPRQFLLMGDFGEDAKIYCEWR
jgi:hypothetical protein